MMIPVQNNPVSGWFSSISPLPFNHRHPTGHYSQCLVYFPPLHRTFAIIPVTPHLDLSFLITGSPTLISWTKFSKIQDPVDAGFLDGKIKYPPPQVAPPILAYIYNFNILSMTPVISHDFTAPFIHRKYI